MTGTALSQQLLKGRIFEPTLVLVHTSDSKCSHAASSKESHRTRTQIGCHPLAEPRYSRQGWSNQLQPNAGRERTRCPQNTGSWVQGSAREGQKRFQRSVSTLFTHHVQSIQSLAPFRFVVVSVLSTRQQTPVCKRNVNPTYAPKDATFDFPLYLSLADKLGSVELVIWDKDMLTKDYLGEVALPLDDWFRGGPARAFDHPDNQVPSFHSSVLIDIKTYFSHLTWQLCLPVRRRNRLGRSKSSSAL